MSTDLHSLLEYILTNIVDNPSAIHIEDETQEGIIRFNVTLDDTDYARVIGRQGYTIKALTDVLRLCDARKNESQPSKIYINITASQTE
jgi:predicted RNA-binding protein YlqC (UPF0109 family)